MRETVRSGRRENYYVTDNSFIDNYARELRPPDIAVYHALERYANCHTGRTWVGTAKVAKVLNISQRTVQRSLKVLEELKLIRIVDTPTLRMYFILPVPPRPKMAATPLFDEINDEDMFPDDDTDVALVTPVSQMSSVEPRFTTIESHSVSSTSRRPTLESRRSDTNDTPYKEEQYLLNKTKEQDLFNKISKQDNSKLKKNATRIIEILRLPNTMIDAAIAALEIKTRGTTQSIEDAVTDIWTEATRADRRGVSREDFILGFQAQILAERILDEINLPPTNNAVTTVTAALKAEAKDRDLGLEETASLITTAAIGDRRRGIMIDRFYFENCKWRSNVRASKAEQRKLDNLEVNAKVKQRLRERLGTS